MSRDTPFQVSACWPAVPKPAERDIAHITIATGNCIFTRLADVEANANRDYVRASAVSLAFWFADNWWRLRWESLRDARTPSADWRLRHELTSGPGGTMWPPIMIYGTGARVALSPPSDPQSRPDRYALSRFPRFVRSMGRSSNMALTSFSVPWRTPVPKLTTVRPFARYCNSCDMSATIRNWWHGAA